MLHKGIVEQWGVVVGVCQKKEGTVGRGSREGEGGGVHLGKGEELKGRWGKKMGGGTGFVLSGTWDGGRNGGRGGGLLGGVKKK